MKKYVAFLRAINVGGYNVVKMEQLKTLFEELGFKNVETFIASGNVIFESNNSETALLESKVEKHLFKSVGTEVTTFIRTINQLEQIISYRPFPKEKYEKAVSNNIGFIREPLSEESLNALKNLGTDIDDFHSHKTEVYWLCKKGQSKSKFSGNVFEKRLKTQVTFRGFKTLDKLLKKYTD